MVKSFESTFCVLQGQLYLIPGKMCYIYLHIVLGGNTCAGRHHLLVAGSSNWTLLFCDLHPNTISKYPSAALMYSWPPLSYTLGQYGHERTQGGGQPAMTQPPFYVYICIYRLTGLCSASAPSLLTTAFQPTYTDSWYY